MRWAVPSSCPMADVGGAIRATRNVDVNVFIFPRKIKISSLGFLVAHIRSPNTIGRAQYAHSIYQWVREQ